MTETINRPEDEIQTEINETDTLSSEHENLHTGDAVDAATDVYDGVIDLTATRKKRFQVDLGRGPQGVLELNTSDMSVITRLENLYPRLEKLSQDASIKKLQQKDTNDENALSNIAQTLKVIDSEMRELIDEIFDSNVSELCAPEGSMFDPFNGEFRFERICETISKFYGDNISEEFRKMSIRLKKRTDKYTKGR